MTTETNIVRQLKLLHKDGRRSPSIRCKVIDNKEQEQRHKVMNLTKCLPARDNNCRETTQNMASRHCLTLNELQVIIMWVHKR